MLRLVVEPHDGRARLTLHGDDGAPLAAWEQADAAGPSLARSPDGHLATVVAGDVVTVVRIADGSVVASGRSGRGVEASLPLDARWTLEMSGELALDGGHTGFFQSWAMFGWPASEASSAAEAREELRVAARVPVLRRIALRRDELRVVLHESHAAPVDGGEMLLWPPIVGPTGVLLRHAVERDEGPEATTEPQRPWLVGPRGAVAQLPFELGVSPLTAMPDGRWLLPGADTVWRDDYDEPLSLLADDGTLEPLLVGGRPVPASRVLREAAPHLLDALAPVGRNQDVPWASTGARLDVAADELRLVIEIDREGRVAMVLAALPLDGTRPARLLEHLEPAACEYVVAP